MASGLSTLGTALRQVERLFELDSGTVAGLDDASLWERFVDRGDEAAFEALVIRHGPMVLKSARAIVGDHHAAEDVFQTTFVALVRRSRSIRRAGKLAGSIVLRGDEAAPVSVRLGPWGSVTGRLVGVDGVALVGGLTVIG